MHVRVWNRDKTKYLFFPIDDFALEIGPLGAIALYHGDRIELDRDSASLVRWQTALALNAMLTSEMPERWSCDFIDMTDPEKVRVVKNRDLRENWQMALG